MDAAQVAVQAAVEKAKSLGIKINVAVVDSGGDLSAFLRMPGAFLHSIGIAIDKAYTSASFGFPTSEWQNVFAESPMLSIGIPQRPRTVVFGGGLPIELGEQRIGGIGVSGGSEQQDVACAEAGLHSIQQLVR